MLLSLRSLLDVGGLSHHRTAPACGGYGDDYASLVSAVARLAQVSRPPWLSQSSPRLLPTAAVGSASPPGPVRRPCSSPIVKIAVASKGAASAASRHSPLRGSSGEVGTRGSCNSYGGRCRRGRRYPKGRFGPKPATLSWKPPLKGVGPPPIRQLSPPTPQRLPPDLKGRTTAGRQQPQQLLGHGHLHHCGRGAAAEVETLGPRPRLARLERRTATAAEMA